MSLDTLSSHVGGSSGDGYQQSIGFANALSQAIIREEGANYAASVTDDPMRQAALLEDDALELAGAPWAKEGILKHKIQLISLDKKGKDKNWNECFAVIEKGWMTLFSFNTGTKSARSTRSKPNKNKTSSSGNIVGGGNWMENAEKLASFMLRQAIASAMPPPGYSKARPYVWALSLPNGAVHFFQVGTFEIIKEWVSTANYWSARLSKEPLIGAISNVEYGWGDALLMPALQRQDSTAASSTHGNTSIFGATGGGPTPGPRPSLQGSHAGSFRSSFDHGHSGGGGGGIATTKSQHRLLGDKAIISDWSPPVSSMMASQLHEIDQLRALRAYVANVERELSIHNELRGHMSHAFAARSPNQAKASSNWEKKSSYLLHEIVKFKTYCASLEQAQRAKERFYAERERMADEKLVKEGEAIQREFGGGGEEDPNRQESEVLVGAGIDVLTLAGDPMAMANVTSTATPELMERDVQIPGRAEEQEGEGPTGLYRAVDELDKMLEADMARLGVLGTGRGGGRGVWTPESALQERYV